ncbi:hypothetical protein ACP3V3_02270 [Vibrio sp. PNB22_3_1]
MRVTDSQTMAMAMFSQQASNASLNRVYEQIMTGKKINHISDDPVSFVRAQLIDANMKENVQFTETMGVLTQEYSKYEVGLDALEDLTLRANELILQGRNGTLDAVSREGFAIELESIRDEIIGILNTNESGRYLYSGTAVGVQAVADAPPYALGGNADKRSVQISDGIAFDSNITADELLVSSDVLNQIDAVIGEFRTPTAAFESIAEDGLSATLQFQEDVLVSLSTIGGRINAVERMKTASQDISVYSQALHSSLVDVDYAEASIELNTHIQTLQASQKTFMQLMNSSLFEML